MKNISSSILTYLKRALLLTALCLPAAVQAASAPILVFGDSLSAGYGIDTQDSWPSLLQQELDRNHYPFRIVNASISGDTTLGGRQRIGKLLEQYKPAIVIVALGANDGLRGYSAASIESNLSDILAQIKPGRARVLLAGMKLPPNYGESYTRQFQAIFPRLAEKHRVRLLPFLLEGVTTEQFQADYLHPSAASQAQIMRNVMHSLKPLLH